MPRRKRLCKGIPSWKIKKEDFRLLNTASEDADVEFVANASNNSDEN